MFNKVILVGHITRDTELKYPSNFAVGTTTIAVNTIRYSSSSDDERKEETCFVDLTFFGKSAEIASQYLKKGKLTLIEGRLKFDQWTNQKGEKQSKHSIVVETFRMLDKKNDFSQSTKPYTRTNEDDKVTYRNTNDNFNEKKYSQEDHKSPMKEIQLDEDVEDLPF